ncbi:uncharacterized protein L199_001772 [Kwoniella botswanensis]|uniref:uncharacterized protein n=1 Tax=Kwoniella botswanensis TaxID=1268659 RepID=UPI00315D8B81
MPPRRKSDHLSSTQDTAHTRQTKRTKASSACDACRLRRSRCELINQDGCHRCRVLGTRCSLRSTISTGQGDDVVSSDVGVTSPEQVQPTLLQVDQRAARIERMVSQLLHERSCPSRPGIDVDKPTVHQAVQDENWSGAAWQIMGGLGQLREYTLVDPVSVGLISEVDMKNRQDDCSSIPPHAFPLRPSLTASQHPLLRCAIVRLNPPFEIVNRIESMLHRNLALLSFLRPSRDLLCALLILSYAVPVTAHFNRACDPYGVCIRLLDMALSLGLDERVEIFRQQDRSDLYKNWMDPLLWDVVLWYSSIHRAAIYSFFTSPSCSTRLHTPPLHTVLPLDLAQSLKTPLHHLALEASLLELFRPLSASVRSLRTAASYEDRYTTSIINAADELKVSLRIWRDRLQETSLPSTDYLIVLSLQMEMTIYMRTSTEAGPALPTPLGHGRRSPIISRLGKEYVRANIDHMRHVLERNVPLAKLPSWNFTMSFLPYATLESIKQLHESDVSFDLDLLDDYRRCLMESHPTASNILQGIAKMRTDPGWRSYGQAEEPDTPAKFSYDTEWWSMFDWLAPLDPGSGADLFPDGYWGVNFDENAST